ncbi:hypothetical protein CMV_013740 [Castanea mollissima]|uniref:Glycoside hydrolase family 3 N-terminal domain-containing protein n=1 Tax=Castanea mollissima TaxID=60419 RepID=A0A8J4R119_9ROSI|nr:hypothetical protein CMV_013740 [Castanea mollissima]
MCCGLQRSEVGSMLRELHKKVAACAKHYVGDGGTVNGINENDTAVTPRVLYGIHMPPYYHSIIKGVSTIMVSRSSVNGVKMHANEALVTRFLKKRLHFRGFVISDSQGIERITSPPNANYTYSIQAAILAGIDMVMAPYNYPEFIDGLTDLVNKNVIPMSRIDDAVSRILLVKFTLGLFEKPMADDSVPDVLGAQGSCEKITRFIKKWKAYICWVCCAPPQETAKDSCCWNSCKQLGLPMRWMDNRMARTQWQ